MKFVLGLVVTSFLCALPLQARDPAPKAKKETPVYRVEAVLYSGKNQIVGFACVDQKGHRILVGMSLDDLLSAVKQIREQMSQESL